MMTKSRKTIFTVLLLACLAGVAWWLFGRGPTFYIVTAQEHPFAPGKYVETDSRDQAIYEIDGDTVIAHRFGQTKDVSKHVTEIVDASSDEILLSLDMDWKFTFRLRAVGGGSEELDEVKQYQQQVLDEHLEQVAKDKQVLPDLLAAKTTLPMVKAHNHDLPHVPLGYYFGRCGGMYRYNIAGLGFHHKSKASACFKLHHFKDESSLGREEVFVKTTDEVIDLDVHKEHWKTPDSVLYQDDNIIMGMTISNTYEAYYAYELPATEAKPRQVLAGEFEANSLNEFIEKHHFFTYVLAQQQQTVPKWQDYLSLPSHEFATKYQFSLDSAQAVQSELPKRIDELFELRTLLRQNSIEVRDKNYLSYHFGVSAKSLAALKLKVDTFRKNTPLTLVTSGDDYAVFADESNLYYPVRFYDMGDYWGFVQADDASWVLRDNLAHVLYLMQQLRHIKYAPKIPHPVKNILALWEKNYVISERQDHYKVGYWLVNEKGKNEKWYQDGQLNIGLISRDTLAILHDAHYNIKPLSYDSRVRQDVLMLKLGNGRFRVADNVTGEFLSDIVFEREDDPRIDQLLKPKPQGKP